MQSFVILCRFFLVYRVGTDTKTCILDRAFMMLSIEIILISAF